MNIPKKTILYISIAIISFIVHFNSIPGDFVWDDLLLIVRNPAIKALDPSSLFSKQFFPSFAWSNPQYYRPITNLSFWLDYRIWGLSSHGFHLTNVILNILCALLVFWLLTDYIPVGKKSIAWVSTVLFTVHPYHTESVAFISGRTDIICTILVLMSLMAYIEHRRSGRFLPLYLSMMAFILSLLSKELGFVLIPILIAWEFLINRPTKTSEALVSMSPFIAIGGLYLPLNRILSGSSLSAIGETFLVGIATRLFYIIYFIAKYLVMLFAPFEFNAFRLVRFYYISFGFREIIALIIFFGFFGLIVSLLRKRLYNEVFWLIFIIIALLPVINFIPLGTSAIAERFLYLPSVGYCVALTMGLDALDMKLRAKIPKSRFGWSLAGIIIFIFAITTVTRNYYWRSDYLVYQDIIRADPRSAEGHGGMARVYYEMGELDSAFIHALKSISIADNFVPAWIVLGNVLAEKGRFNSAQWCYLRALRYTRNEAHILNALGIVAQFKKDINSARDYFRRFIELEPHSSFGYQNIGRLEFGERNYMLAIEYLERARSLDPDDPLTYRVLSEAYEAIGDNVKAREYWQKYLDMPGIKIGDIIGEEKAPGVLPPREKREK